jgi:hypothetical protein
MANLGLHIPDEWSRESVNKHTSKQGGNKHQKQSNESVSRSTTVEIDSIDMCDVTESKQTVADPVKKRKRAVSTASVAAAAAITTVTDVTVDTKTSIGNTTAPTTTSDPSQATIHMNGHMHSNRSCDESESVMRGLFHQVEKQARRSGCSLQDGIYLDSIMTHVPYAEVLQTMFGGNAVQDSACVPVVTRAYEESYMREALSGVESACVMGTNCECQFIDEHNPFTGVQFTLPVEAFSPEMLSLGVAEELSQNKLCVLCCRKNTQSLFYEALYNHRAYSACIQLYGNICDRPGEYSKEAMLICPLSGPINNMPIPVVAHQRNRYSVVVHNGVRQLRQHRVGYEDFQMPSSSRC